MELEHVLTIIAPRPTQTSHSTKMRIPCIRSRAIHVPLGRSVLPKVRIHGDNVTAVW